MIAPYTSVVFGKGNWATSSNTTQPQDRVRSSCTVNTQSLPSSRAWTNMKTEYSYTITNWLRKQLISAPLVKNESYDTNRMLLYRQLVWKLPVSPHTEIIARAFYPTITSHLNPNHITACDIQIQNSIVAIIISTTADSQMTAVRPKPQPPPKNPHSPPYSTPRNPSYFTRVIYKEWPTKKPPLHPSCLSCLSI